MLIYREERSGAGDWIMGTESSFKRSLKNPQESNNPDTYKGEFWVTGPSDNGGVHTNSGVFAHIYYMLAEGKTGINDNNDAYTV